MANGKKYYFILLAGVAFWCLLILSPALLPHTMLFGYRLDHAVYPVFSPLCHQFDSRSIYINGEKLGVCSRCSAIYFGFLLGVLAWPLVRKKGMAKTRFWWLVALLPMLSDVGCDFAGIHASDVSTRIVSGGIFGVISALLLTRVFLEACSRPFSHHSPLEGSSA